MIFIILMFFSLFLFISGFISGFISVGLFVRTFDPVLLAPYPPAMWTFFYFLLALLLGGILFYQITNKFPRNDLSEYYLPKDFKKLLVKNGEGRTIQFVKKNGVWICENNKYAVKLDLSGYLFQKSYLVSFVVRNLRFPVISRKLPYEKYLFRNKFLLDKRENITLIIIDGDKKSELPIVRNGISRYGFIAKHITESHECWSLIFRRCQGTPIAYYIDEKLYRRQFKPKK